VGSAIIHDKQKEKCSETTATLQMSLAKNTNLNDRSLSTPATDHLLNKDSVSTNTLEYHVSALLENILKFERELVVQTEKLDYVATHRTRGIPYLLENK
jgi:hypothetical protein